MSADLHALLERNRVWARSQVEADPDYFERLVAQQTPAYLWIGCSDSRVPATMLVDLPPGEMFVHRNVANLVVHTDLNCLSVMQYAVDVLRVRQIIICGHYGCGGVEAALNDRSFGLIDNWLRHVQDVRNKHLALLAESADRHARLCELNVIEQVVNVCQTTVVRQAWERGQRLHVSGWIYGIADGLLRDLGMSVSRDADILPCYEAALAQLHVRPDTH